MNDDFVQDFTAIWNAHMVTAETAAPSGRWETVDRFIASRDFKVYMRANKSLGLYMPEFITPSHTSGDVRDNIVDAYAIFNTYVAQAQAGARNKKGGKTVVRTDYYYSRR